MSGWIASCTMFCPVTGTQARPLPIPGVNALHGTWTCAHVAGSDGSGHSMLAFLQSAAVALSHSPWSATAIVSSIPRLTAIFPDGAEPLIENSRPPYDGAFRQVGVAPEGK